MLALSRFTRTTQRPKYKRMERCLILRRYVVRVNRDDASINTSARTRRLCLRRTGLHVGFLCLCLRRCKPGFIWHRLSGEKNKSMLQHLLLRYNSKDQYSYRCYITQSVLVSRVECRSDSTAQNSFRNPPTNSVSENLRAYSREEVGEYLCRQIKHRNAALLTECFSRFPVHL